ncbi:MULTISPECIES: bifunctional phosphoribosylaminoimidazolecarboxamide formyltransferase/IMP cyclohydrolase [unclassified Actinobaculum]|uniref:bifunctional phosphoribosylaminoimidazolecarboxamide formyltransferase/IMP cyclohydrolase n=1 Tax=unclassified Actinobaculum TaxID=2609299 RepID=UPI000D52836D|nr:MULTISPECIES: bifunctional phosphoribosylaminoimidazolecarboxamide formyltransferase/IMP cyclohydrolase [unclassified Actinobaculum]AWE42116.1 bifunctional phosphoribosylaminoimidazolecarboxamide formyltransferase/inosine monophosphate cyclohydrolase [Actinobaculum sp. 313]RTE50675.1 bifunctional phosphoribosylaminoimidazolecarboxamide formyltransferase/IMP cyclohydrolase [Actinobaculum sp. 352]
MRTPLTRALISVYEKNGIAELATALHRSGCEIVSTGSTADTIAAAGVPVTAVDQVTGFPECFDGRVKTLHPRIHGGILADPRLPAHRDQLEELGLTPFDLVVVNLYPFQETVAAGAGIDECIEKIDIGGPAMVRAAAKNHANVAVVVKPLRYPEVAAAAQAGGFTAEERRQLASEAFAHTAAYDAAVAEWMSETLLGGDHPTFVSGAWHEALPLRYGENPHQRAGWYVAERGSSGLAGATQLGGKAMSYNNYQDADAALRAAYDHDEACVAVIKHTNPCGVAIGRDIAEAHRKAHACDPVSAYGGVIAANREVTVEMAQQVKPIFTEVITAPGYTPEALELLRSKKNLRILRVDGPASERFDLKPISGGLLVQERDALDAPGDDPRNWTLVAGQAADEAALRDLEFAWRAIRAVKSNAILLARDGATVGVGMGQVNRVDSCRLAVERANTLGRVDGAAGQETVPERARGSVAASDAFFPFADGLRILTEAGVRAVVQPGGSIRDEEVIAAAQEAGVTMYLTGCRHFLH